MKIGIFAQYDTPYKPVADITMPNLREYCERHGYSCTINENPVICRDIVWDRVQLLLNNIDDYDWVVHMDADVLITNHFVRLEEFLGKTIVLSESIREDGSIHLNDGVMFVRNCDDSHTILNWVWNFNENNPEMKGVFCAQDVFEMYKNRAQGYMLVERQKRFNSFLYTEYGMPATTRGNWTPGDFALHLPGRTTERRVEIFNNTRILK